MAINILILRIKIIVALGQIAYCFVLLAFVLCSQCKIYLHPCTYATQSKNSLCFFVVATVQHAIITHVKYL